MKTYINILLLFCTQLIIAQQLPVLTTTPLSNADSDMNFGANGNYAMNYQFKINTTTGEATGATTLPDDYFD